MAGTFGVTGKTAKVWLHLWVLAATVSRPVLSQPTGDDPRCSPSGFTLVEPSSAEWFASDIAGAYTGGFNLEVDMPVLGYTVGETRKAIVGGKLPVYLLMGPDATSISPQAVGVDFFSFLDFRTIVSVTATAHLFSGSPDESFVNGAYVFPDFPSPGRNSSISYAGYSPATEFAVTGGTNAFMGITGQLDFSSSGANSAATLRYANGFKPVCQ